MHAHVSSLVSAAAAEEEKQSTFALGLARADWPACPTTGNVGTKSQVR